MATETGGCTGPAGALHEQASPSAGCGGCAGDCGFSLGWGGRRGGRRVAARCVDGPPAAGGDERAGQEQEAEVNVRAPLVANREASIPLQPGEGAFDHPALASQCRLLFPSLISRITQVMQTAKEPVALAVVGLVRGHHALLLQFVNEKFQQVLPDPELLPITQASPTGPSRAATQLLRQRVPRGAGLLFFALPQGMASQAGGAMTSSRRPNNGLVVRPPDVLVRCKNAEVSPCWMKTTLTIQT